MSVNVAAGEREDRNERTEQTPTRAGGMERVGDGGGEVAQEANGPVDVRAEVAVLDELLAEWKRRALGGDADAVDKVLAIQRQRATLLQTWPSGGVRVSAGPGANGLGGRGDEKEVRVVIEYVDDWRQAGRGRVEGRARGS